LLAAWAPCHTGSIGLLLASISGSLILKPTDDYILAGDTGMPFPLAKQSSARQDDLHLVSFTSENVTEIQVADVSIMVSMKFFSRVVSPYLSMLSGADEVGGHSWQANSKLLL
jgi:hypothetical protein